MSEPVSNADELDCDCDRCAGYDVCEDSNCWCWSEEQRSAQCSAFCLKASRKTKAAQEPDPQAALSDLVEKRRAYDREQAMMVRTWVESLTLPRDQRWAPPGFAALDPSDLIDGENLKPGQMVYLNEAKSKPIKPAEPLGFAAIDPLIGVEDVDVSEIKSGIYVGVVRSKPIKPAEPARDDFARFPEILDDKEPGILAQHGPDIHDRLRDIQLDLLAGVDELPRSRWPVVCLRWNLPGPTTGLP